MKTLEQEVLDTNYSFYFKRNAFVFPVTTAFKSFVSDLNKSDLMDNFSSCLAYFKNGFVTVFLPREELEIVNNMGISSILRNHKIVYTVDQKLREIVEKIISLSNQFENKTFSSCTDEELSRMITEYRRLFNENIIYGYSQVFVEHGISAYFLDKAKAVIPESNIENVVSIVLKPEYHSYSLREELEFIKILSTVPDKKDFLNGEINTDLQKRFENHSKKWGGFWANFSGKIKETEDFIEDGKIYIRNFDPKEQLLKKETILNDLEQKKLEYVELFKNNEELLFLIDVLQRFSELKDYRRSNISLSQFKIKPLLREIESRLSLEKRESYFLDADEMVQTLKNKKVDKNLIAERKDECLMVFKDKEMLSLPLTNRILQMMTDIENEYFKGKDVKGFSACRGNHTGKVKVVNDARDIHKIEQGDVLVSKMTTPDILIAIKKCGAIVTDEGGLTCHAAIVSREFGIPCIIATKVATRVLKDGDLVEVDAVNGKVRIIRSAK